MIFKHACVRMSTPKIIIGPVIYEFFCCFYFYFILYCVILNLNDSLQLPPQIFITILPIAAGILVTLTIIVFVPLSGAHINPCFTLSFAICGYMQSWLQATLYVMCQFLGSLSAVVLTSLLFMKNTGSGTESFYVLAEKLLVYKSNNNIPDISACIMECILTAILIFSIFTISIHPLSLHESNVGIFRFLKRWISTKQQPSKGSQLDLYQRSCCTGAITALLLWMGIGHSSAIFNPARILGPLIISGKYSSSCAFLYITSQFIGSILGLAMYVCAYWNLLSASRNINQVPETHAA